MLNSTMYKENKELNQRRSEVIHDLFNKHGLVIFPEQRRIYSYLSNLYKNKRILVAGCGNGVGAALLFRNNEVLGTDKLTENLRLSSGYYSWINWEQWDIGKSKFRSKFDIVVAIEVIEHVKDYKKAIKNLIDSTNETLWISTPNRNNDVISNNKPSNSYHVKEFTPSEMIEMLGGGEVYRWDNFEPVDLDTKITPLVYRLDCV